MTNLHILFQLIQESNDSITQMKSIESLVSLSAKVDFECRVSVAFMLLFSIIHFARLAPGKSDLLGFIGIMKLFTRSQVVSKDLNSTGYGAVIDGKHLYRWRVILQYIERLNNERLVLH